jgi:hypothetical protein
MFEELNASWVKWRSVNTVAWILPFIPRHVDTLSLSLSLSCIYTQKHTHTKEWFYLYFMWSKRRINYNNINIINITIHERMIRERDSGVLKRLVCVGVCTVVEMCDRLHVFNNVMFGKWLFPFDFVCISKFMLEKHPLNSTIIVNY